MSVFVLPVFSNFDSDLHLFHALTFIRNLTMALKRTHSSLDDISYTKLPYWLRFSPIPPHLPFNCSTILEFSLYSFPSHSPLLRQTAQYHRPSKISKTPTNNEQQVTTSQEAGSLVRNWRQQARLPISDRLVATKKQIAKPAGRNAKSRKILQLTQRATLKTANHTTLTKTAVRTSTPDFDMSLLLNLPKSDKSKAARSPSVISISDSDKQPFKKQKHLSVCSLFSFSFSFLTCFFRQMLQLSLIKLRVWELLQREGLSKTTRYVISSVC